MLQGKIHGVISAKAATGHGQARSLILPSNEGNELVQKIALVLQVAQHAHPGMNALVVPALVVDSVGAEYLQFAAVNFGGERGNHAAIFVFEESSHGSGKNQQGRSGMAKHERLNISV